MDYSGKPSETTPIDRCAATATWSGRRACQPWRAARSWTTIG